MGSFWRSAGRWDPVRVAAVGLGAATVALVAAYVVSVAASQATTSGVLAVIAFVAIAAAGLLYAWRLGTGGVAE